MRLTCWPVVPDEVMVRCSASSGTLLRVSSLNRRTGKNGSASNPSPRRMPHAARMRAYSGQRSACHRLSSSSSRSRKARFFARSHS